MMTPEVPYGQPTGYLTDPWLEARCILKLTNFGKSNHKGIIGQFLGQERIPHNVPTRGDNTRTAPLV